MMQLKYFVVMLGAVLCMAAVPIPDGWQPPARKEVKQGFSKGKPAHFMKISEDFNGDGMPDEAMLLVNKSGREAALFVFVSQGQDYKTIILDNLEETWWLDTVGVRAAAPGSYDTTCGRLYFNCDPGDPSQFSLKLPGIIYSKEGRESCLFYWYEEKKRFKRLWIVD